MDVLWSSNPKVATVYLRGSVSIVDLRFDSLFGLKHKYYTGLNPIPNPK